MAIYQYFLAVVPVDGVLKKHGFKPNQIGVSTKTGFFESDVEIYWKELEIEVEEILPKVDKIVKRTNYGNRKTSYNWKTYTEDMDNDASIYLDEKTLKISTFSFRADLREKKLTFLMNMIELGKEYNWMFMDRNGKLLNPNFDEIKSSIKESNAYRFLKDPIKFLKSIDKDNQVYTYNRINNSCN